MEFLLISQAERCRMDIYREYLKKIPQLLVQLETVENMYQKAVTEEAMLPGEDLQNHSVALYAKRLTDTKEQCVQRAADIRQQLELIFSLKAQIEEESSALQALMKKQRQP